MINIINAAFACSFVVAAAPRYAIRAKKVVETANMLYVDAVWRNCLLRFIFCFVCSLFIFSLLIYYMAFVPFVNRCGAELDLTLLGIQDKIVFMKKLIAFLVLFCALPDVARAYIDRDIAVVRVMNKAAGKVYDLNIPVGNSAKFEKLDINVRACKQSDPFDAEDYFAFLEISTTADGLIFSNWMSRNEPGVRPLQNADYDVWLVKCESEER